MSTPNNEEIFTLPPGRIVWGSVHKGQSTDTKGQPIIIKSGANKGQPGARWAFGLAIAKQGEKAWWDTPWGQRIIGVGQRGFINGAWQRPDFAWKITDGDSTIPNTKGKAPSASDHNRGHWIVAFTTYTGAPAQFMKNPQTGTFEQIVNEAQFIKTGFYAEVNIGCKPNTGESAGLYMTPRMVAFVGYGPEIIQGPDVSEAGFGQSAAPAGALATPVGGFNPSGGMPQMQQPSQMQQPGQMPMPQQNGLPVLPQGAMMGQVAATGMPQMQPQQLTAVVPHTAILGMPQHTGMPQMPNAQPALQPQRVMTAKANGATYEQFIGMPNSGWNDQTLVDQGFMVWQ